MSKSNLEDIDVWVHVVTEKAVLVSDTGEEDDAIWLPKSQVQLEDEVVGAQTRLTAPEWLLQDRGLI